MSRWQHPLQIFQGIVRLGVGRLVRADSLAANLAGWGWHGTRRSAVGMQEHRLSDIIFETSTAYLTPEQLRLHNNKRHRPGSTTAVILGHRVYVHHVQQVIARIQEPQGQHQPPPMLRP